MGVLSASEAARMRAAAEPADPGGFCPPLCPEAAGMAATGLASQSRAEVLFPPNAVIGDGSRRSRRKSSKQQQMSAARLDPCLGGPHKVACRCMLGKWRC